MFIGGVILLENKSKIRVGLHTEVVVPDMVFIQKFQGQKIPVPELMPVKAGARAGAGCGSALRDDVYLGSKPELRLMEARSVLTWWLS